MLPHYNNKFIITAAVSASQNAALHDLMQKIGKPVSKMLPENIIMIGRAGSFLYDLSTPDSDVDYIVVYAEPTEVYLHVHVSLYIHVYSALTVHVVYFYSKNTMCVMG